MVVDERGLWPKRGDDLEDRLVLGGGRFGTGAYSKAFFQ